MIRLIALVVFFLFQDGNSGEHENGRFVSIWNFQLWLTLDAYCNKKTTNTELKLKNDLLCEYDTEIRPSKNNTPITMRYVLRNFDYVRHFHATNPLVKLKFTS